jgi:hypothetical protein
MLRDPLYRFAIGHVLAIEEQAATEALADLEVERETAYSHGYGDGLVAAATEARRELLAKVEGLPTIPGDYSEVLGAVGRGPWVSRAAVLALLAPSEKGARG